MSLKPNKEIIKLYSIAIKFQKDGNQIEAEKFYKKILGINPNHVETINNLGLLYKSLKTVQEGLYFLLGNQLFGLRTNC